jgi:hypothetical protein
MQGKAARIGYAQDPVPALDAGSHSVRRPPTGPAAYSESALGCVGSCVTPSLAPMIDSMD